MRIPETTITIRISLDALEAIDDGIAASIREIQTEKSSRQQRRLSLLWNCQKQIDRALEGKLKEFYLYNQEADQRFDENDKRLRKSASVR